jgi:hypothetical protein
MKRLYSVVVEFEYAAMAESEADACSYAKEAINDMFSNEYACARLTVDYIPTTTISHASPPDWDSDSLVYGADTDTTLEQAIAAEKARLQAAALSNKQGDLFNKDM